MNIEKLREGVLAAFSDSRIPRTTALRTYKDFLALLDTGRIRSAEKINGIWTVNEWVKKGILLGFRLGKLKKIKRDLPFRFFDKETVPLKSLSLKNGIRIVPGGTSIRSGAYIAPSVIVMPPAYINIGAYVDAGTMIDSHALVGSCAQVGKRVHLSAASQIGGVLEPVGALPVIVEDDVLIGGNCGIYEGTVIGSGAVIGTGVTITASTPVYDIVRETIIRKNASGSVVIPENAVVVPGSRSIDSSFAEKNGLQLYTPVIVKYRDASTDARTALEESLR